MIGPDYGNAGFVRRVGVGLETCWSPIGWSGSSRIAAQNKHSDIMTLFAPMALAVGRCFRTS
jgi:hypothetical protein